VLIEKYQLTKKDIGQALSAFYHCPFIDDVEHVAIAPNLIHRINPSYLKANYWVPLRETPESIEVLIDDPHAFHKLQDIKRLFPGKKIRCTVGLPDDIAKYAQALTNLTPQNTPDSSSSSLPQLENEGLDDPPEDESAEILLDENDSAIVRLVNQIITSAYKRGASDIHIEPEGERQETRVRFRVDGRCYEYLKLPATYRRALVSRLKIMARLDIAERRRPQDGKIKFRVAKREIELRVATIPTAGFYNEDVVMRILDNTKLLSLDHLSMSERNLREFTGLLQKPYGLFLCVGPTGAGKTTTLHSALSFLNAPDRKIWAVEDPIEITQPGLRQVQVNHKIGFDFASALRAFLRADPDIIMVGEIRDQETAEVSLRASLTGHLVLSTLHTNNAVETVTRFLDMGIDPFHFADALLGVLAQRLARTLCPDCKERYHPTKEEYEALAYGYGEEAFARLQLPYDYSFVLFRAKGCETCQQIGYKGRIGLHELLVATEDIARLIHERAPKAEILHTALAQGMTTLMQDGITKVLHGLTDYSQVKTVTMR
jgi:type II secretory ATPase GspE/PulE/Tfp pilus assembly ATPase PilB-like protein